MWHFQNKTPLLKTSVLVDRFIGAFKWAGLTALDRVIKYSRLTQLASCEQKRTASSVGRKKHSCRKKKKKKHNYNSREVRKKNKQKKRGQKNSRHMTLISTCRAFPNIIYTQLLRNNNIKTQSSIITSCQAIGAQGSRALITLNRDENELRPLNVAIKFKCCIFFYMSFLLASASCLLMKVSLVTNNRLCSVL